jgi:hypothetical protein
VNIAKLPELLGKALTTGLKVRASVYQIQIGVVEIAVTQLQKVRRVIGSMVGLYQRPSLPVRRPEPPARFGGRRQSRRLPHGRRLCCLCQP